MNRKIISISDDGIISVPNNTTGVKMTIAEIAGLFGIFYPTAKRHIRAIEKSGIATGDYSMSCVVDGISVHPEYYGLEMITAVAFRLNTSNASLFRRWLMERSVQPSLQSRLPIAVFVPVKENRLPS